MLMVAGRRRCRRSLLGGDAIIMAVADVNIGLRRTSSPSEAADVAVIIDCRRGRYQMPANYAPKRLKAVRLMPRRQRPDWCCHMRRRSPSTMISQHHAASTPRHDISDIISTAACQH